jgi:DNA-binding CsgD family transcriptional regulator
MHIVAARAEHALGLLELGAGRPEAAAAHLRVTGEFALAHGLGSPVLLDWAGDLVEAHVRAGEPDRARRVLAVQEREAAVPGRPGARAVALRCAALLGEGDGAGGDPDRGVRGRGGGGGGVIGSGTAGSGGADADDPVGATLLEALSWHERANQPFEEARTRLCLGEHLRRRRRLAEAREALADARRTFVRLGASAWVARADAELRAAGTRPSGRQPPASGGPAAPGRAAPPRLTPQEMQVALVVAAGATNAEAATQLFLSPKTIEYHLSNAYRKLGIRSRAELVRTVLSAGGAGA